MSLTRLKSRFGQGCIPSEGSGGEWISLSFPASVDCNPWLQAIFKANLIRQSSSQIRSDQISRSVMSDSLRPHELQHTRPPCPSPTPGVHPDSLPSSRWCHPAISSSVVPFSSCPQSHAAIISLVFSLLLPFPIKELCDVLGPHRWSRIIFCLKVNWLATLFHLKS